MNRKSKVLSFIPCSGHRKAAAAAELGLARFAAVEGVENLAPPSESAVTGHPEPSRGSGEAVDGPGRALTKTLLIFAYWNSKVFSSEMAAQATINHERVHVKIFKENWNSFKAASDSWDGYMDKCCCVDFAWELVIGLEEIWKGHAYIENGKFDKLAYGGGEKIIELGEKHLARGEELVNDSIVKLIDNQCSFSASSF